MNFKDLNIKLCYESGVDDIIEDFYEPVLGVSKSYDRIAGFFSSSSFAIAARGLASFIQNGGKMRLITSPRLKNEDVDLISKITENASNISAVELGIDFNNIQSEFERNHVKALGWMISKGLLEIRLAIVCGEDGKPEDEKKVMEKGLFHQKVGVLTDVDGNQLSFSGSINETAAAWIDNDEEFKVFKAWSDASEYFDRDKNRFEEIWNGKRTNVKIYSLPSAIKNDLIQYSSDFDIESISLRRYIKQKLLRFDFSKDKSLFFYQADALNKWKNNQYQMLFEMATGTGKTRTAIAGIRYLNSIKKKLITIVSTPQNTLSKQWMDEVRKQHLSFDECHIIDGSVTNWNGLLIKLLLKNGVGMADHCIFFTTHVTASSDKFTSALIENLQSGTEVLFVGDETHWLGARKLQKALLDIYKYRIGLSATPSRWFDDSGTERLVHYYGNCNFEFTIHDALTQFNPLTGKHFLVNYNYKISKVGLTQDEGDEYKLLTTRITQLANKAEEDPDARILMERLLEKRANIIKNAEEKYEELERILDAIELKGRIENLLVFVSPQQIQEVQSILARRGLVFHKLTEEEGTRAESRYGGVSEREFIIQQFKRKNYQALVAMKCLDEGIDIPSAGIGILMASSTNPREYIQRIGRIIRQDTDKGNADLYDICVDTIRNLSDDDTETERRIRQKEVVRLKEIATNSINGVDALKVINSLDI